MCLFNTTYKHINKQVFAWELKDNKKKRIRCFAVCINVMFF